MTIANSLSNKFTSSRSNALTASVFWRSDGALADLSLDIHSARITTFGEKVIDTFYVTDLVGQRDHQ